MTSEVRGARYGPHMRAGRLHTALVYFGIRDDPALLDRLQTGPVTASRVALGAVAVVIAVAVLSGILALLGAPPLWSSPRAALAGVAGGIAAWAVGRRRRRRRRTSVAP
jgi:membrane associated rhomboid family serine protease